MEQPTETRRDVTASTPFASSNVLLTVVGWIVGGLALLLGATSIATDPGPGIWILAFGLLVFPPVHTLTARTMNFRLTGKQRDRGAVLVFIAFVIAVPKTPRPEANTAGEPAPAPQPAANAPAQVVPQVPEVAANQEKVLGDSFRLGDFTYRVTRVGSARTIGNQFINEAAGPNAAFVVVEYEITNEGNETHTALADDFEVIDGKGRKFRPSSRGATAFMMAGGKDDFLVTELQPGITKPSVQVFEVPEASLATLRLRIPEKGFFGSDEVIVDLTRKRG